MKELSNLKMHYCVHIPNVPQSYSHPLCILSQIPVYDGNQMLLDLTITALYSLGVLLSSIL